MNNTPWSNIYYGDVQPSSDPTRLARIGQALADFANNPFTNNLLNQIDADLASRSLKALISSHIPNSRPGPWNAPASVSTPDFNVGDFAISMTGNSADQNPFAGIAVDGFSGDFTMGLERTLLHEIMHIYTSGIDLGQPDFASTSGYNFGEEISVFAENLVYVRFAEMNNLDDSGLRIGHLAGSWKTGTGGVSGTRAFDQTFNTATVHLSKTSDFVSFKADGFNSSESLTKFFYVPGTTVLEQGYDHYILHDLKLGSSTYYRHEDGSIEYSYSFHRPDQPWSPGMLTDMLAYDPEGAMEAAAAAAHAVTMVGKTTFGTILTSYLDPFWRLGHDAPKAYVGLGADRWVDTDGNYEWDLLGFSKLDDHYSLSGPVGLGTDEYTMSLAIDRSTSTIGTLLIGAAGYENAYVDHTGSVDRIRGGSGDDVVVAGLSTSAEPNILEGMSGMDLLIGRSGSDRLLGGDGADLLFGGGGHDYLDGGAGIDFISFQDQALEVEVRLDLGYSHTGDPSSSSGGYARQDLHNIEGVIGTTHGDTIFGRGHSILFGMEGDDTFHLKDGDIARGGSGADVFYIEADPNTQTNVSLIDLDADDRIYVNGQLYNQGLIFDAARQQFYDGTLTSLSPQVDNHLARLDFAFGSASPFLHVYMEGFAYGDAGIVEPPIFGGIVEGPYLALFAPQDLIF